MNYTKNLLELKKKSKSATIFGIISCILAITIIVINYLNHENIPFYLWIFSIYFLLSGIANIMAGQGHSIDRLFGKAFIEINNEKISLKTGVLQKVQAVNWKEIDSIDYKLNNLIITKTDKAMVKLALNRLEYSVIQEIKEVVNIIGTDKEIDIHQN